METEVRKRLIPKHDKIFNTSHEHSWKKTLTKITAYAATHKKIMHQSYMVFFPQERKVS